MRYMLESSQHNAKPRLNPTALHVQKLDKMDLDDILNRAEDHETMAAAADSRTSLNGKGPSRSFAAMSDVENDRNWEGIILLDEQRKFELEDAERKVEELAAQELRDRKWCP
jgi:chromodomain-helicase-DNA-binding protein 1